MKEIIDGIEINYIKEGADKKNILLLHGWGSNITLFAGIIAHLSKRFTVYAFDMPGFGKSSEPPVAWNVNNYVDFTIKFINKMKIKNLSILGHSFGGRVIIKIASEFATDFKIDKLILVGSAGIPSARKKKKVFKTKVYKALKNIVLIPPIKKVFPNALDKLKRHFGSPDYKSASPVMRDTLVKTIHEDLTKLLKDIKNPTLLIWGENDTETPFENAKIMNSLIPDSGIVKVENAGHYCFLENPLVINKVLDSFLTE